MISYRHLLYLLCFIPLYLPGKEIIYSALIGIIISLVFLIIDLINYKKGKTKEKGITSLLFCDIFGAWIIILSTPPENKKNHI